MESPAFDDPELRPGDVAGSYRIVRRIGRGSMGIVYEAVHLHIERRAAIKVLASELSGNPRFTRRFRDEANAVNRVRHPGLVEVFEFGFLDDGLAFFVMELLDGETLGARLAREKRLGPRLAVSLAREVASAIGAAHARSIVHRDLKPENVMLARRDDGPGERVKVLDFGVAKLEREGVPALATHTGAALGTPHYMAPEQCIDARRVGPPADVYSLGIMLFEMLAGRRPFVADAAFDVMAMHVRQDPPSLAELAPGLPTSLCALVHAMIAKEEEARPSMDAVAAALDSLDALDPPDAVVPALGEAGPVVAAAAPLDAKPARPEEPPQQTAPSRLRPSRAALVVAALLLIAGALVSLRVAMHARGRAPALAPEPRRGDESEPPRARAPITAPAPPPSSPPSAPPPAPLAPAPTPAPAVLRTTKVRPHPSGAARKHERSPSQTALPYEPIELEP